MEDCIMSNVEVDDMSDSDCLEKGIIKFKDKIHKLNMLHENDKKLLKDEMLKIVDIIKRYAPDKFKHYENLLAEYPDIFMVRYELTVEDSLMAEAEKKINDIAIDEDRFCPVSGKPLRIFFKGLFGIDGVYDDAFWSHQCPTPKNNLIILGN